MTTIRSRKNKGKRLQNQVRDLLQEKYKDVLELGDFKSTTMGESGLDIQLSPAARKVFSWAVECKNQEALHIWKSLEQAETNKEELKPLLVFKRNRTKTYVALELTDFLNLLDANGEKTKTS